MSATSIHPPVVRRPPGPSRASALGLLPRMMRNRLEVMAWAVAEYGEAVRVPLGPKTLYLFNHPDHARHVLADNAANYTKGIGLTHARRVIGDGLLTSEGELWRKQRRVIQPVFQAKRLARQVDAIALEAEALVDRLRERAGQGPVDIRQEMTALALGVLGRTLIDADLGAFEAVGEAFETVQDQAMFEMMSLGAVPLWLPLPRTLRFRKAKRYLQEVTDSLAADRRKNPNGFGDDIVSRLIESVADEPDQQVGRERMRDELVTLLLAGHETTASTLSWALHLLDLNPEVRERVHQEAVEVFSRGPLDSAALHGFTYTSMVLEEVMRMYPPVWLLTRIAREADEIGGFAVPAGADVIISPYLLQRSEKWWPEPDKFDPERFASDRRAGRERYSYIPFGAGPRFCVGNNLGMMEATIVLAALCRDLQLASVPNEVVEGEPMLTLRVRGGLPMTVTAR